MLIAVALENRVEEVEVPEQEILEFPWGIIGFEDFKSYALFQLDDPLFLLQSVDSPYTGFVVIDPAVLDPSYRVDLAPEERALLRMESKEQPVVLAIVTLDPNGTPSTANLRAPIAFNVSKRLGVQVVLQDAQYPVRFPVPPLNQSDTDTKQVEGRVDIHHRSNGTGEAGQGKRRC